MSAFLVSPVTINRIIGAVLKTDIINRYPKTVAMVLKAAGVKKEAHQTIFVLASALAEMNCLSFMSRYGEVETKDERMEWASRVRREALPDSAPLLVSVKAIQCLLYQAAEGDVPETPLYKALQALAKDLCELYVLQSEVYGEAPGWD